MPTIKASEKKLHEIFDDAYVFEIPTYQRPYSWTTEEVEDLLDDLQDAIKRDREAPYFLGSIVIIKDDDDPKSDVVDGQQRLTTLSMLFCVLRELATGEFNRELDVFVREASNSIRGTQGRFRVTLRARDRIFFQENVQNPGMLEQFLKMDKSTFETDSQKQIFENAKYLQDRLGSLDEQAQRRLAKFISRYCYLVAVTTEDKSSAYRIFSVLNNRGLDLAPTDILKADVVGAMPSQDEEREYSEKWEHIEEELGRDGFQNLFGHIRMIHLKEKQRRTLQEEIQDSLLKDVTAEKAKGFVDQKLEPYADVYKEVSRASYSGPGNSEVVNQHLRHLCRLDNADWIPPAMAFFQRNRNHGNQLVQFAKDLERLAYGLFIRRANINERINRYADVLQDIEKDEDLWRDDGSLQLSSGEKTEILNRLDGEIYTQTRVHHLPVLLRLDSLLADAGASYDHSAITVEHVLPQSPAEDSQWMKWFSNAEERAYWTHRLANLVLLTRRRNSRASNFEFDHKKSEYFQRGGSTIFAITTKVVNEPKWTPEVLERRQGELIGALKKEWRLD